MNQSICLGLETRMLDSPTTSPSIQNPPTIGFLRLAVAPAPDVKAVLVAHWRAYPVGGDVALDSEQGSMVTYQWRRKVRDIWLYVALD